MVGSFTGTRILVLNVIEWANDAEDSIDSELALKIEERGRRMLSSILLKNELDECERIVKLGDPVNKIAEVAERNHVEMIIMGARGLGNSSSDLGSISRSSRKDVYTSLINNIERVFKDRTYYPKELQLRVNPKGSL